MQILLSHKSVFQIATPSLHGHFCQGSAFSYLFCPSSSLMAPSGTNPGGPSGKAGRPALPAGQALWQFQLKFRLSSKDRARSHLILLRG